MLIECRLLKFTKINYKHVYAKFLETQLVSDSLVCNGADTLEDYTAVGGGGGAKLWCGWQIQ